MKAGPKITEKEDLDGLKQVMNGILHEAGEGFSISGKCKNLM